MATTSFVTIYMLNTLTLKQVFILFSLAKPKTGWKFQILSTGFMSRFKEVFLSKPLDIEQKEWIKQNVLPSKLYPTFKISTFKP